METIRENNYNDSIYRGIRNGVIGIALVLVAFGIYSTIKIYKKNIASQKLEQRESKIQKNSIDLILEK